MNEKLTAKLIETKTLVIGGGIVLILTILSQLASSVVLAHQAIPCLLLLGQPKMPDKLYKSMMDKENM